MGIKVYSNKSVIIDHSHQELVDTSFEGNPTEGFLKGLHLRYVFRRKTTKHKDGDGNPLVYALKEMNGYHMQPMYRDMLYKQAAKIMETFVEEMNADMLVDVPSSKPLCRDFARKVAEISGIELRPSDFLRKKTIAEILADIDANFPSIKKEKEQTEFKNILGNLRKANPDIKFAMKEISKNMRHFFQPFTFSSETPSFKDCKITLIDDLVSSGTSIISVADCLKKHGALVDSGVCLLSELNAKHPRDAG